MSLPPRKTKIIVDKSGVKYRGMTYEYPIRIGKLRNFRGYRDVALELNVEGKQYYLLIYDKHRGLVGKAKMNKLDAVHALYGTLHRVGFSDTPITQKEFHKLFGAIKYVFIGE